MVSGLRVSAGVGGPGSGSAAAGETAGGTKDGVGGKCAAFVFLNL